MLCGEEQVGRAGVTVLALTRPISLSSTCLSSFGSLRAAGPAQVEGACWPLEFNPSGEGRAGGTRFHPAYQSKPF